MDSAWAVVVAALGAGVITGAVTLLNTMLQQRNERLKVQAERAWRREELASTEKEQRRNDRLQILREAIVAASALVNEKRRQDGGFTPDPDVVKEAQRAAASVFLHRNRLTEESESGVWHMLHGDSNSKVTLSAFGLEALTNIDPELFATDDPNAPRTGIPDPPSNVKKADSEDAALIDAGGTQAPRCSPHERYRTDSKSSCEIVPPLAG